MTEVNMMNEEGLKDAIMNSLYMYVSARLTCWM